MTRPTFPTDMRFRRIAAAIADAVTVALAKGERVSARDISCRCPMGCVPGAGYRPGMRPPRLVWMLDWEFNTFVESFDRDDYVGIGPFAELGREYRRRFP